MDKRLLEIIVCPICKGPLRLQRLDAGRANAPQSVDNKPADVIEAELICDRDHLAYPIRDDIPVMLVDNARRID